MCGCTHLTAFSALFVDNSNGCGGEWEWDVLRTVAASLIAFNTLFVIGFLIVEYFVVYKKRQKRLKRKVKRRGGSRAGSVSTISGSNLGSSGKRNL